MELSQDIKQSNIKIDQDAQKHPIPFSVPILFKIYKNITVEKSVLTAFLFYLSARPFTRHRSNQWLTAAQPIGARYFSKQSSRNYFHEIWIACVGCRLFKKKYFWVLKEESLKMGRKRKSDAIKSIGPIEEETSGAQVAPRRSSRAGLENVDYILCSLQCCLDHSVVWKSETYVGYVRAFFSRSW